VEVEASTWAVAVEDTVEVEAVADTAAVEVEAVVTANANNALTKINRGSGRRTLSD